MNNKKELQVAALENGTVIDHIPSEKEQQERTAGSRIGERYRHRPHTLRKAFHRGIPPRLEANEQQYYHRLQPSEQEAGQEGHH